MVRHSSGGLWEWTQVFVWVRATRGGGLQSKQRFNLISTTHWDASWEQASQIIAAAFFSLVLFSFVKISQYCIQRWYLKNLHMWEMLSNCSCPVYIVSLFSCYGWDIWSIFASWGVKLVSLDSLLKYNGILDIVGFNPPPTFSFSSEGWTQGRVHAGQCYPMGWE